MSRTLLFICAFMFLGLSESKAQALNTYFDEVDRFFAKNVSAGLVDYTSIHANPKDLQSIMMTAENISLEGATANVQKAFWINAYNLAVIQGVINRYPIDSPLDVSGFFDKQSYKLAGTTLTLNDIENSRLRAVYDDARIHFVLVCGAKGCPPIIPKAYRPETLERQLNQQTVKALNDKNFIKKNDNTVQVSEIFNWYRDDFVDGGGIIGYVNRFRKEQISEKAKIKFYSYDWRLNDQK